MVIPGSISAAHGSVKGTQERYATKVRFMEMYKGGVIASVSTPQQAQLAQQQGARGILITSDPRKKQPGGSTMTDAWMAESIMGHVLIPTFGRVRAGHEVEAQAMSTNVYSGLMESVPSHKHKRFIEKHPFNIPFICDGVATLADAVLRIDEGAAMLCNYADSRRTNVHDTYAVVESLFCEIEELRAKTPEDREAYVVEYEHKSNKFLRRNLVNSIMETGQFPVPFFAQGGITAPEDVAMLRSMGCDGVILSTQVFHEEQTAAQILKSAVVASSQWDDVQAMAKVADKTA
ncbi:hypothetical protein GGF46_003065 [Coemansia sp. RSA 552]|nr:hypothetical protein GGF46_003065 [Coemansia sp. RSA 552]